MLWDIGTLRELYRETNLSTGVLQKLVWTIIMDDDEILHESIFIDEGCNLRRSEGEKSHRYFECQMSAEQRRYIVIRGVTIHKSHNSVRTSVFKSRFCVFFSTAVLIFVKKFDFDLIY